MTATGFAPGRASPHPYPDQQPDPGWAAPHGQWRARSGPAWLLAGSDTIAVTVAAFAAATDPVRGFCYGVLVLAAVATAGLYRPRIGGRVSDQAGRLAGAAALPVLALLPWTAEHTALALAGSTIVLLIGLRMAAVAIQRSARRRGLATRQTLIIGAGEPARAVYRLLREHPELGLRPCGALDSESVGEVLPVLGRIEAAAATLARFRVTQVLVCAPAASAGALALAVQACRDRGVRVSVLPRLPELGLAVPMACLDEIWGIPFIPLRPGSDGPGRRAVTRMLDLIVGSSLLLATAPLMLILALAVWLDLRLPPLFRQVRVVGHGRLATIAKLRTLRPAGDPETTWVVTAGQSSPLGKLLRTTHADELPQLASVVRGDMALVGPRPERPYFASRLRRSVRGYAERDRVRAGLTGWAQVNGLTGDTSIEDRARFDNFYIEYWSIWLDLLILARTGLAALSGVLTKGGNR